MRKLAYVVIALIVVVAILIFALPSLVNVNQYHDKIQAELQQKLSLADLKITASQVAITDQQKHQSRSVYDHIDLGLSNYAPNQPFNLSLAAHLPGQGTETVSFDGKAGPMNSQNSMATPLDGR